ncbi:MAG: hypothetical protein ACRCUJ_06565 [Phocaeicola sp.]
MNLNELRDAAYKNACEKGFHNKEYRDEHWLCLVNCELAEAVEADRANRRADMERFSRGNLGNIENYANWYIDCVKGTVEEELADSVIRFLDFAGLRGFNIEIEENDFFADEESVCESETFTETIYAIMQMPLRLYYEYDYSREKQVNDMIETLFNFAEYMKIDFLKQIELKMKYNQSRCKMHGKNY